jgi:hypothetical protein
MTATTPAPPPVPLSFVIATFAGAIAVGVLVFVWGLHGQLGAAIP